MRKLHDYRGEIWLTRHESLDALTHEESVARHVRMMRRIRSRIQTLADRINGRTVRHEQGALDERVL